MRILRKRRSVQIIKSFLASAYKLGENKMRWQMMILSPTYHLPSQLIISCHLIADIQKAMFRFRKRITLIQVEINEMVNDDMVDCEIKYCDNEIISFSFL